VRIKWLGWAGVEIEHAGERVVVDPLRDTGAVFAPFGERGGKSPLPDVLAPAPGALAAMVTHLHRDHADADALSGALAPGAPVFEPSGFGGSGLELAATAQAEAELGATGLERCATSAWTSTQVGPFTLSALPAVDGTGDPQVSWLIEAGGKRVVHLGDTMFHCWWWRIAERFGPPDVVLAPINGARLTFPHRVPASPLPGVMDPEQAALASELLRAGRLVPIHYDGYALEGIYEPVPNALERAMAASSRVAPMGVGEEIEV
jgi:L-ascorbate metabolism protein UlaG (beta-lactamase superfamily)